MTSLSVVIPAYNEELGLPTCVANVHSVLKDQAFPWEIIIVNDGSTDRTGSVAKKLSKKYPNIRIVENNPNLGYGGSLRSGFQAARKDFIVTYHADNQFDFSEVYKLIQTQKDSNADIVSGIRTGGGADPLHRKINRWGWNTIVRALFGYLASDIDCGFKLFRRTIFDHIHLTAERGAMIDTQILASCRARNMTISEVDLTHLPRTTGHSTGANLRVIYQSFVDLFSFWWQLRQELWTEKGKAVFKWEVLLISCILVIAGGLRFYKIGDYLTFLGDEGRDALVARDIILGKNFPFIGPGTSVGNMYLGPFYYYLMAPALLVSNFSPIGPAILVGIIDLFTILFIWWVSRQWSGRIPALVIVLLYAVSVTTIHIGSSSWNPNIMPFFSLFTMYGIWKVWRYGYWRWLIATGVGFAIVLQSHYLGLLLLPTIVIFWLLALKNFKHKNRFKYTFLSLVIFLLIMSPLVIFDLHPSHPWLNTKALIKFFTVRQETVNIKPYKAIPNILPIFSQITGDLLLAKDKRLDMWFSVIIAICLLGILFIKREPDLIFVATWISVGVFGLSLYKQHIYTHYFGFLIPSFFLSLGFIIKFLSSQKIPKVITGLLIIFLVWTNLSKSRLMYPPNKQLLRTQQLVDLIISESKGEPFNMALISKNNYDASYRYFLELKQSQYYSINEKVTSQLFVICEDQTCEPIGHPLWEIAKFGWAKKDKYWETSWGIKLYRLFHNPTGNPS